MNPEPVHLHQPGARATLCGQSRRGGLPALPYRSAALPIPPRLVICEACLACTTSA